MPFALRVLSGLILGFSLGLSAGAIDTGSFAPWLRGLDAVGTMWIAAIRMTVLPLVISSIITGVNRAPDPRTIGRLGGRAITFFVVATALAGVVAVAVGAPMLERISLDPSAVEALRATASSPVTTQKMPTIAQWFIDLVPVNPLKAAADGAMLPVLVFSLAFGIASTRLDEARRGTIVRGAEAVLEATLVLVRWVISLAPIGVFILAIPLAAKLGISAIGALAGYTVIVCTASVIYCLVVLYPAAALIGRVPVREFARAWLAPQAVAFSSRSSMAALPAMIEATRDRLKFPASIHGFLIPLAASVFRPGAGVGQILGALFIAKLYGITLGGGMILAIGATAVVTSFSVPGIPGGSIVAMVPVLMVANLPVEGIGILLGVDTVLDMFRTMSNTTGHLSAATVLARGERAETNVSDE